MALFSKPITVSAAVLRQLSPQTARMIMLWPSGVRIIASREDVQDRDPLTARRKAVPSTRRGARPSPWRPGTDPAGPRHRYGVPGPGEVR